MEKYLSKEFFHFLNLTRESSFIVKYRTRQDTIAGLPIWYFNTINKPVILSKNLFEIEIDNNRISLAKLPPFFDCYFFLDKNIYFLNEKVKILIHNKKTKEISFIIKHNNEIVAVQNLRNTNYFEFTPKATGNYYIFCNKKVVAEFKVVQKPSREIGPEVKEIIIKDDLLSIELLINPENEYNFHLKCLHCESYVSRLVPNLQEQIFEEIYVPFKDIIDESISSEQLSSHLRALQTDKLKSFGLQQIVNTIRFSDRKTEINIIENLFISDPEFAFYLLQQIFSFNLIFLIKDEYLESALKLVNNDTIALALKGETKEVLEKIYNFLPQERITKIEASMRKMEFAKSTDTERAQSSIANAIRCILQFRKGFQIKVKKTGDERWRIKELEVSKENNHIRLNCNIQSHTGPFLLEVCGKNNNYTNFFISQKKKNPVCSGYYGQKKYYEKEFIEVFFISEDTIYLKSICNLSLLQIVVYGSSVIEKQNINYGDIIKIPLPSFKFRLLCAGIDRENEYLLYEQIIDIIIKQNSGINIFLPETIDINKNCPFKIEINKDFKDYEVGILSFSDTGVVNGNLVADKNVNFERYNFEPNIIFDSFANIDQIENVIPLQHQFTIWKLGCYIIYNEGLYYCYDNVSTLKGYYCQMDLPDRVDERFEIEGKIYYNCGEKGTAKLILKNNEHKVSNRGVKNFWFNKSGVISATLHSENWTDSYKKTVKIYKGVIFQKLGMETTAEKQEIYNNINNILGTILSQLEEVNFYNNSILISMFLSILGRLYKHRIGVQIENLEGRIINCFKILREFYKGYRFSKFLDTAKDMESTIIILENLSIFKSLSFEDIKEFVNEPVWHYQEKGLKDIRLIHYSGEFIKKIEYKNIDSAIKLYFYFNSNKKLRNKIFKFLLKTYPKSNIISKLKILKVFYFEDIELFRNELQGIIEQLNKQRSCLCILIPLLNLILGTNENEFQYWKFESLYSIGLEMDNKRILKINIEKSGLSMDEKLTVDIELLTNCMIPCLTIFIPPNLYLEKDGNIYYDKYNLLLKGEKDRFYFIARYRGKGETIFFLEDLMNYEKTGIESFIIEVK